MLKSISPSDLLDINEFVSSHKDPVRAIQRLIGFCLKQRSVSDAIRVFSYMKENGYLNIDRGFKTLDGLLHLLVETSLVFDNTKQPQPNEEHRKIILEIFDLLRTKNIIDEGAFFTMIKYHCHTNPNLAFSLIKVMKEHCIPPHLRSYRILMECAPSLHYMNKVYQSLSEDIKLQSDHSHSLIPDKEVFLVIFTQLRVFALSSCKEGTVAEEFSYFRFYMMQYRKYHLNMDIALFSVVNEMLTIYRNEVSFEMVNIESNGTVLNHPYCLKSIDVSSDQQRELLEALILQNEKTFKSFDKDSLQYDVVLDGANIAFYDNSDFLSWKIIKVVMVYIKRHKKVLIVLSQKRKDTELLKFVAEHSADVSIYWARIGVYDDLIWLYASIKASCPLVTNDNMTDHIFYIFPSFFKEWIERHQVHYHFDKGRLNLYEPTLYSCRIQSFDSDKVWFLPIYDVYVCNKWLMIDWKNN